LYIDLIIAKTNIQARCWTLCFNMLARFSVPWLCAMFNARFIYLRNPRLFTSFFWKLGIRSKNRLIREDQSHRPLVGVPFKAEQVLYRLSPPKLTPEGIEAETFRGANSKIPSQPIGQPQMGFPHLFTCWPRRVLFVQNQLCVYFLKLGQQFQKLWMCICCS